MPHVCMWRVCWLVLMVVQGLMQPPDGWHGAMPKSVGQSPLLWKAPDTRGCTEWVRDQGQERAGGGGGGGGEPSWCAG
jgi:hypothetical protein